MKKGIAGMEGMAGFSTVYHTDYSSMSKVRPESRISGRDRSPGLRLKHEEADNSAKLKID